MSAAERFATAFRSFWAAPDLDRLPELLRDEVVLHQPLSRPMRGIAAARRGFERIFTAIPDLCAEVDRWSGDDDCVFIEFRLRGTIGGRLVEWPVVDRFTLRDGRATERMTWFDPLPLLAAVLRHPPSWRRFLPVVRGR